jgi:enterochelin esterase family protein
MGANVISPEVNPDRTVTFRLNAPNATSVSVSGSMFRASMNIRSAQMTKDEKGVWSVTTGPFEPDMYTYKFNVDGVSIIDPANTYANQGSMPLSSILYVNGDEPMYYDAKPGVPHGTVTTHYYYSEVTDGIRSLYVYTPPDYDAGKEYPVLYLMGGSGEIGETWWLSGNANFIMDNLLAEGKAKPMIIVMVNNQLVHRMTPNHTAVSFPLVEEEYLKCIIPFIEENYKVIRNKSGRAISGLSMGGRHAQYVGLRNLNIFGSIGILSAALTADDIEALKITDNKVLLKDPSVNNQIDYLFIGAGPDETNATARHQLLHEQCESLGIKHEYYLGGAAHDFITWRNLLYYRFLPNLWR